MRSGRGGVARCSLVATLALAAVLAGGEAATAQAGWFCPETGQVTVQYEGSVYYGMGVQAEGAGLESTYTFSATDGSSTIIGTFELSIVDCVEGGVSGTYEANDLVIQAEIDTSGIA